MPAKPRAFAVVAVVAVVTLLASACASRHRQGAPEATPPSHLAPPLDLTEASESAEEPAAPSEDAGETDQNTTSPWAAPPPARADRPREEPTHDPEEALATYERLLVAQELRLQDAGVDLRPPEATRTDADPHGGSGLVGGVSQPTPSKRTTSTSSSKSSKATPRPKTSEGTGSGRGASSGDASPSADARCALLDNLQASTCDLRQRICDLATRHPETPRYAQVCARATHDCARAREAATRCGDR